MMVERLLTLVKFPWLVSVASLVRLVRLVKMMRLVRLVSFA